MGKKEVLHNDILICNPNQVFLRCFEFEIQNFVSSTLVVLYIPIIRQLRNMG